jgi:hypothetical protein
MLRSRRVVVDQGRAERGFGRAVAAAKLEFLGCDTSADVAEQRGDGDDDGKRRSEREDGDEGSRRDRPEELFFRARNRSGAPPGRQWL